MHFTQEDYRKIEAWLYQRVVRDTDFPNADPLSGAERMPIIQDGKNKTVGLNDLVKQVAAMKLPDFYNVTTASKKSWLTLKEAVSLVPAAQRKLGLTITFHNENGNWLIYQFKGDSINQWESLNYWNNIIQQALEELVVYPDEEDITGVRDGNRTFLKFKNREYNPEEFCGMGMIILRRNLVGTEACTIDDEDHLNNILTQDMINQENTVYIVEYDFDLDGKVISIPNGCTLWFQGGSINNGTIYLQETAILGAFEFADMGTAKLFGKFNTGQIMTFSNDSYKAKEGGYFVASTKDSSATVEEDAKNERETFYDINPDAYVTKTRQELRWWNGEEWILILDITDYQELKSIINDLIDKHNAEMAACYKYFKARCYALEVRMTNAEKRLDEHDTKLAEHESRITKVEGDITSINQTITEIQGDITNIQGDISSMQGNISSLQSSVSNVQNSIEEVNQSIQNFKNTVDGLDGLISEKIESLLSGYVKSVTVGEQKYTPDGSGNITLPAYPEGGGSGSGGGTADKTKGKLMFTGASTAEFDGSKDVTVNIPEAGSGGGGSGGGGTADKTKGTLYLEGAVNATFNGSEDVHVQIPSGSSGGGGGGSVELKPLIIKSGDGNEAVRYDGKEQKDLQVNKLHVETGLSSDSTDIDLLKNAGTLNLTRLYLGSANHPIILCAAKVTRVNNNSSTWTAAISFKPDFISVAISQSDCAVVVSFSGQSGHSPSISAAIASFSSSTVKTDTEVTGGRERSNVVSVRCSHSGNKVYVQGARTDNKDNDSINFDPAKSGGTLIGFELVVVGYVS